MSFLKILLDAAFGRGDMSNVPLRRTRISVGSVSVIDELLPEGKYVEVNGVPFAAGATENLPGVAYPIPPGFGK